MFFVFGGISPTWVALSTFWVAQYVCTAFVLDATQILNLTIPWPSGIIIDSITDSYGGHHRFGRLQLNAVQMRPDWSHVFMMEKFLSIEQCINVVNRAELYAAQNGWSKARHIDYLVRPTKDLAIDVIFPNASEYRSFMTGIEELLWPRLRAAFDLGGANFRISDLFITKYNASTAENRLGPHRDKSPWSFVVSLNNDFEGGGTYVFAFEKTWRPPQGGVIFFSGYNYHAGVPITSGVRYILAGFVDEVISASSFSISDNKINNPDDAIFLKYYNPIYDGYASQHGFKSGDRIVGLEVCSIVSSNTAADEHSTTLSGSLSPLDSAVPIITRKMIDITPTMSDEEWVKNAQSCEQLIPGSATTFAVVRL